MLRMVLFPAYYRVCRELGGRPCRGLNWGMMTMNDTDEDTFLPEGVDLHKPSVARIYDYLLGGHANWAIDREVGDRTLATFPYARPIVQGNRQVLFRVVRQLMRLGVRQFVDLGAGVPTMAHIHSVADAFEPGTTHVVYVDNEPVAVAESQILLENNGDRTRHAAINADIRAPQRLWRQVLDTGLIDLDQPVALLLIAVLHFEQADETGADIGAEVVAQYREMLPSGSYLAISHGTDDGVGEYIAGRLREVRDLYAKSNNPLIWRSEGEIRGLFGDFELLEPGLCWVPEWHPEETGYSGEVPDFEPASESIIRVGVGRKP